MRIEHIVSDPHRPQTCGKVERLIQTIKKELLVRMVTIIDSAFFKIIDVIAANETENDC
jgi:transposase